MSSAAAAAPLEPPSAAPPDSPPSPDAAPAAFSRPATPAEAAAADALLAEAGAPPFLTRAAALRYVRGYPGAGAARAAVAATAAWRATGAAARPCAACARDAAAHCIVPLGPTASGAPLLYLSAPRARDLSTAGCVEHLVAALEASFAHEPADAAAPLAGVWVFDGRGFSLLASAMNPGLGVAYARVLQAHFPERLGRCVLVDVPWAFRAFWAVVRPFLAEATAAKVVEAAGAAALGAALDAARATPAQRAWVLAAHALEPTPGNLPEGGLPPGAPAVP